jgi:hypothetical protein
VFRLKIGARDDFLEPLAKQLRESPIRCAVHVARELQSLIKCWSGLSNRDVRLTHKASLADC